MALRYHMMDILRRRLEVGSTVYYRAKIPHTGCACGALSPLTKVKRTLSIRNPFYLGVCPASPFGGPFGVSLEKVIEALTSLLTLTHGNKRTRDPVMERITASATAGNQSSIVPGETSHSERGGAHDDVDGSLE